MWRKHHLYGCIASCLAASFPVSYHWFTLLLLVLLSDNNSHNNRALVCYCFSSINTQYQWYVIFGIKILLPIWYSQRTLHQDGFSIFEISEMQLDYLAIYRNSNILFSDNVRQSKLGITTLLFVLLYAPLPSWPLDYIDCRVVSIPSFSSKLFSIFVGSLDFIYCRVVSSNPQSYFQHYFPFKSSRFLVSNVKN